MKKIVLFSIVLCFQMVLFGQKRFESFGVLAGGNLYKKSPNLSNQIAYEAKPNLISGVFASFRLNKKLGFLVECNYNAKGESQIIEENQFAVSLNLRHYYVSLPLQLQYFPFSKGGFSLTTGLEPAYLAKLQFTPNNGGNRINANLKNEKRLDMVANLGLRYDWEKTFIALRFSQSLLEVNKISITDANGTVINNGKQLFQGFQLYAGMALFHNSDL